MEKKSIITGKTLEEAKANVTAQLGLDADSYSYQVVQMPKSGFLGFGAQPAKIEVTYEVPDPVPEAPKVALSSASRSKPKPVAKKPEAPKPEAPKAAKPTEAPKEGEGFDPSKENLTAIPSVTNEQVDAIIEKIRQAKRPVLNAGNGIRIAGAFDVFRRVADKLGIPVVTGWTV